MKRDEISAVTHGGLAFHNPLDSQQVDEVLGLLDLAPQDRVLDLGCGPGELLLRLHRRYGVSGTGIDFSARQIEEARRRAAGTPLEFIEGDAGAFERTGFALTACLGSMHAVGGLAQLAAHTRPGGRVLIADGFWRTDPDPHYLAALGATRDELPDRTALLTAGLRHGLRTTYVAETSDEAWDRYEWTLIHNAERDGRPEVLDWASRARARYAGPGGRGTLGFALVLMKRPGPAR
jgi:cyclopropane fatty-acyl-phospholipid synthase-like methyltransferase